MVKNDPGDKVKKIFKDRFWELYKKSGCKSVTQFAKMLDMNRQSVDRYYNAERLPDMPSIVQICNKMNVTSDWLLGLSDVQTASADIQNAVAAIGLTEKATLTIREIKEFNPQFSSALSHLIEQDYFPVLLSYYNNFIGCLNLIYGEQKIEETPGLQQNSDGTVTLGVGMAADFYKKMASDIITSICDQEKANRFIEKYNIEEDKLYVRLSDLPGNKK